MTRNLPFGVRLRNALLAARRNGIRGAGAYAARRGDGLEFAELREYVEGDDPRRIDWAATARAGGLQTRVMLEDRALYLAVAIDASRSMLVGRTRSNYDLACDAAQVWYSAAVDDDRCSRVATRAQMLREVRGRAAAAICTKERETEGASFADALKLAIATLPRGTRLLAIGDFLEAEPLVALVRAATSRFDFTALLARDPWHDELPLGGFVRLRDAETGRVASAYVGKKGRDRFKAAVAERESRAIDLLRRAGARVATLDEQAGAERAIAQAFALA